MRQVEHGKRQQEPRDDQDRAHQRAGHRSQHHVRDEGCQQLLRIGREQPGQAEKGHEDHDRDHDEEPLAGRWPSRSVRASAPEPPGGEHLGVGLHPVEHQADPLDPPGELGHALQHVLILDLPFEGDHAVIHLDLDRADSWILGQKVPPVPRGVDPTVVSPAAIWR